MQSVDPYELNKIDLRAMRECDDFIVAIDKPGSIRVQAVKRKDRQSTDPFASDKYFNLPIPVEVYGFGRHGVLGELPPDARCFAMFGLYPSQHTPTSSIFATLRVGDAVKFLFHPDYHTNGYAAVAGVHADALLMKVYRKGLLAASFELLLSLCPDNTARLCRNLPPSEGWKSALRCMQLAA